MGNLGYLSFSLDETSVMRGCSDFLGVIKVIFYLHFNEGCSSLYGRRQLMFLSPRKTVTLMMEDWPVFNFKYLL
jgi:hypothetical protein